MIDEMELIQSLGRVQSEVLRRWIDLGWVRPRQEGGAPRFDDQDVARVRLICDLHYELKIEEDSLPVVLSLVDQLYAVRQSMHTLLSAIEAQPDEVRAKISSVIKAKS